MENRERDTRVPRIERAAALRLIPIGETPYLRLKGRKRNITAQPLTYMEEERRAALVTGERTRRVTHAANRKRTDGT